MRKEGSTDRIPSERRSEFGWASILKTAGDREELVGGWEVEGWGVG